MSNNPLPSSGPLSFSNINVELGRGSTATISIRTAEQGGYGTIRECKTPLPSGAPPASVSEWRGYNHNATASLAIDETVDGGTSCEDVCNQPVAGTGSLVAYAYTLGGSTNYYANFTCTQGLALGYYADMTRTNCYAVTAASPPLLTITACNVSTTTTTSTTLATGDCWQCVNSGGSTSNLIFWRSVDGVDQSGSLGPFASTNLCSLTDAFENPNVDVTCTKGSTCTEVCTTITCKFQCTYP